MRKIEINHWRIILIVAFGVFMTNIDASIVNVALPTFSKSFGYGLAEVSRVVLSYFLAMSCTLLIFGKLCDNLGARRIFTLGFAFFTVMSVLCGLAPTFRLLILFRFLQGLGGAMLLSSFGALVVLYLPQEIHGRAFGYISLSGGVGFAMGAPAGGLLLKYLPWPWIFLINLPVGILAIIGALRYLPRTGHEENNREKNAPFDWPGAVLSASALFILVAVLNLTVESGAFSEQLQMWMWGAVILGGVFMFWEKRASRPLLDPALFKKGGLVMGLLSLLFLLMTFDGLNLLFPFYLELVKKMPPHITGLYLMIFPILSLFISPAAGHLTDRYGGKTVSSVSTLAYFVAILLISRFGAGSNAGYIIFSFIVFGVALAAFFTANTSLIMGHAPRGKEGMVTALSQVCLNAGGILGINVLSYVFTKNINNFSPGAHLTQLPPVFLSDAFKAAAFVAIFIALASFATSVMPEDSIPTVQDPETKNPSIQQPVADIHP